MAMTHDLSVHVKHVKMVGHRHEHNKLKFLKSLLLNFKVFI